MSRNGSGYEKSLLRYIKPSESQREIAFNGSIGAKQIMSPFRILLLLTYGIVIDGAINLRDPLRISPLKSRWI